jgi:hypothetical protein
MDTIWLLAAMSSMATVKHDCMVIVKSGCLTIENGGCYH